MKGKRKERNSAIERISSELPLPLAASRVGGITLTSGRAIEQELVVCRLRRVDDYPHTRLTEFSLANYLHATKN
jgi:hypothetical protein